jgi:hypothetical protein
MEAVYQQQPMPTNLTGVPITLNVVDSNGNYRTIGTTTSNAYGTYSLTWTPDIPGDFTVIANFGGTESYYPSQAATALYSSEKSQANPTQTAPSGIATTNDLLMYVTAGVVAIIIAIAIVGLVIVTQLRKRR